MGELVPYDELLDSGRLDWLWDGRLHTMYGYTSHDLATFARVLARPCPDCGASGGALSHDEWTGADGARRAAPVAPAATMRTRR